VKKAFLALLLAQGMAGCVATDQQFRTLSSDLNADQQAEKAERDDLRQRISYLETQIKQLKSATRSTTRDPTSDRIAALEAQLASLQQSQTAALTTASTERPDEERLAALEDRLHGVEQAVSARPATAPPAEGTSVAARMAAIEAELKKIEKSSELAVQMGLITTVHSDRNEQGISTIRSELDSLSTDIAALRSRLTESDQQLEVGLLQLKELSAKLK
jgi:chromosome segregation ATPase